MSAAPAIELALIGGTGLYAFDGLEVDERVRPSTPYGDVSGEIALGRYAGRRVAFLARHGAGHTLAPHRINYRANVHALHALGVRRAVAVNAVGGITPAMAPRAICVPHQLIDYTHGRESSFCDADGAEVRHIDFSDPYSASLSNALVAAALRGGIEVVPRGVYGATQGPRLETVAEIARMARDGCDLVGMTGMPEAALAREIDLEYAAIAVVANYGAGRGDSEHAVALDRIEA
ncbi:MAG TPA: S-methyl-5'-thioinosine phosphorylase, partial [Candidatus Saccharimonadia bacterium]|nr:S-methyl-5'-thioinosine phosphorylase [Candidatus Saccharimonadia bacterium]